MGIGSSRGAAVHLPLPTGSGVEELLDSGRDFLHGEGSTPWIHVTSTAIARAESAPLRDYMLQIEDIRRKERNEVLPIPISPSAIVKTSRVL
jgi:hypothetical protein